MGTNKKFLQTKVRPLIPSAHPTLESYVKCRVAIEEPHRHKTALGTRVNRRGSKEKTAQEQHGITHRLIRRTNLNSVGSTDEQSRQQRETSAG